MTTKYLFSSLAFAAIISGSLLNPSPIAADTTHQPTTSQETPSNHNTSTIDSSTHQTEATQDHVESSEHESGSEHNFGMLFLFLAILLIAAKIGGVIEKAGQPAVLGELLAGIVLSFLAFLGVIQLETLRHQETIAFLAEVGAVILLFQIGLESNIKQLLKVGLNAFIVAVIGVVCPFLAGTFLIGPIFFPNATFIAHLFLGASMVATSVGITASVFKSLNILKTRAAQTVLGAAVIDDVLGLIVLAVVSAMASGGEVAPTFIARLSFEAIGFLGGAILLGSLLAKPISNFFSKIHAGHGMKLAIAITFALVFAYAATLVGLAPIVGAFAAGLILDAVHFDSFEAPSIAHVLEEMDIKLNSRGNKTEDIKKLVSQVKHTHIEDMIENVSFVFVPMFFAFTGLQIEIESLLNPSIYIVALAASAVAIIGKLVAGFGAKGSLQEKIVVGMSMVPRGEVGLIFASIGRSLGAINAEEFSAIILVVIVTTFISPPALKILGKKVDLE